MKDVKYEAYYLLADGTFHSVQINSGKEAEKLMHQLKTCSNVMEWRIWPETISRDELTQRKVAKPSMLNMLHEKQAEIKPVSDEEAMAVGKRIIKEHRSEFEALAK